MAKPTKTSTKKRGITKKKKSSKRKVEVQTSNKKKPLSVAPPKKRAKKKPLTKAQRKARSVKGWETRRAQAERAKASARRVIITELNAEDSKLKADIHRMSREELLEYAEDMTMKAKYSLWVADAPLEGTRMNGHIAKSWSRARHLGKDNETSLKLIDIMTRAQRKGGEAGLMASVRRISENLDIPVREVFTLYYSP